MDKSSSSNKNILLIGLGDSITYGYKVFDKSFMNLLKKEYEVINYGVCGYTSLNLVKDLKSDKYKLDKLKELSNKEEIEIIFIINIGINDVSQYLENNYHQVSVSNFIENINFIIKKLKEYNPYKIIFIGLNNINEDLTNNLSFTIENLYLTTKEVKRYDSLIKNISKKENVEYIEIKKIINKYLDNFPDGVHPNKNGHYKIYEEIGKKL